MRIRPCLVAVNMDFANCTCIMIPIIAMSAALVIWKSAQTAVCAKAVMLMRSTALSVAHAGVKVGLYGALKEVSIVLHAARKMTGSAKDAENVLNLPVLQNAMTAAIVRNAVRRRQMMPVAPTATA